MPCVVEGINSRCCATYCRPRRFSTQTFLAHGQELKVAGHMPGSQRHLTNHLADFWLARGAILVIVGLQIGIVNDLTVGPRWFAPCLELALLIPLSIGTAWVQKRARKASTDKQWHSVGDLRRMLRRLAIVLTAVVTLVNSGVLIRLVAAMLSGHAGTGRTLLLELTKHLGDQHRIVCALVLGVGSWWSSLKGARARAEERFSFPATTDDFRSYTVSKLVSRLY